MKKIFLILYAVSACTIQGGISNDFSVLMNFSLPMQEFRDDNNFYRHGFAANGFGGGIQYNLFLGNRSIAWMNDIYILVNIFDRENAERELPQPFGFLTDISGGNFLTVPFLSGLRISIPMGSMLALYLNGQAGISLIRETEMAAKKEYVNTPISVKFESVWNFSWAAGGGIQVNEEVSLGVKYLNLGKTNIDYTSKIGNAEPITDKREFKASLFMFLIGFTF